MPNVALQDLNGFRILPKFDNLNLMWCSALCYLNISFGHAILSDQNTLQSLNISGSIGISDIHTCGPFSLTARPLHAFDVIKHRFFL